MYCGMSLGRVGLDFRGLLPPIFEAAVITIFATAIKVRIQSGKTAGKLEICLAYGLKVPALPIYTARSWFKLLLILIGEKVYLCLFLNHRARIEPWPSPF